MVWVRLYPHSKALEFEVKTREIDISDKIGRDITVNFQNIEIDYNSKFYTDTNCLGMKERKLNYHLSDPVEGEVMFVVQNIFATQCAMAIRDDSQQL